MKLRILIADRQPKVRFALRALLQRQPGLEIVGEVADASSLLAQAEVCTPDLVLLGWELPGMVETGHLAALMSIDPKPFVIALSGQLEARQSALEAGADAFVSKSDPPDRLMAAIDGCCTR
jgi:DNA-binding NarL/FixJ family response regulator